MRSFLIAALCLTVSARCFAQTDTDPATKDDVILYLQTMHSHDMMQKIIEVMSNNMQQSMHDQLVKQKSLPADFDVRMKKWMDNLVKNMPVDEMTQAMIPAYQKHFTHGDITAMNAFYSSPVGQKVLQELPGVMQDGMQEMRPVLNKYIAHWQEQMKQDMTNSTSGAQKNPAQN